jgi:hypothetical protein
MFATMEFCRRHGLRFSVFAEGNALEPFLQYRTPADVRERAARALRRRVQFFHKGADPPGFPLHVGALPHERGTVLLHTNVLPERLPTEEDRAFVRRLLVVRPQWVVTPLAQSYSLLHIRTDDSVLVGGKRMGSLSAKQMEAIQRCVREKSGPWLLISDSAEVVALTRAAFPDRFAVVGEDPRFSAPPGHVARTRDARRLATTVRDMQRVCGAQEIVTVTNYTWTSGFALWLAVAFGIKISTHGASSVPAAERHVFGTSLELG